MNVAEFTKVGVMALIKATQDPTAPIKMQELYKFTGLVGQTLASCSDEKKAKMISYILFDLDATDLDVEETTKSPEFIMALCAALQEALLVYTRDLVKNYKEEDQEA